MTDSPTHPGGDRGGPDLAGVVEELRGQLQSLRREVAALRGRLASHEGPRDGFAKILLVKGDSNRANWQQQWVSGNNTGLAPFVGGMSNTAAYIDPTTATGGGTNVAALLQLRNGSNTAFVQLATAASAPVKFGKLASSWTPGGNAVTLTPCAGPTDPTPTGEANIACAIQFPLGQAAPSFDATTGQILAYMTAGGVSFLLSPPVLPRATGAFQGLFNQGGTTSNWQPDHVRAAAV